MISLGVMTYALDSSQLGVSITKSLNKMVEDPYIDPIVFYREYHQQVVTPMFATMQDIEMWDFAHPVISTNLDTTRRLIKSPSPTKKFFYVNNLEWLYMPHINYDELVDIYTSDKVELIARSKTHFELLESCWKKPVAIIEDFEAKDILELVQS